MYSQLLVYLYTVLGQWYNNIQGICGTCNLGTCGQTSVSFGSFLPAAQSFLNIGSYKSSQYRDNMFDTFCRIAFAFQKET